MNTGRAKIALIFAFLSLNIFLIYNLMQPDFEGLCFPGMHENQLQQIEKFIQFSGYSLEVPLDQIARSGDFITVSPYPVDRSLIAKEAYSVIYGEKVDIYHCPGKQVKFHRGGLTEIQYVPGIPLDLSGPKDEELKSKLEAFLKDRFSFQQLKLDLIQEGSPGERIITYTQNLEGSGLYSSFVRATINEGCLVSIEYFWLNILKRPQEHLIGMITSAEAVQKLVKELGFSAGPRCITGLDLGFYSPEYEAEQWDVPPVWRIIIDHRQIYYINAFTGYLEHDLNINEDDRSAKY